MLRLFTNTSKTNAAEYISLGCAAAATGKVGKARRLLDQAVAADPERLDTIVRQVAQTPGLALYKTFVKKALNAPQIQSDPQRCRNLAWDLAFAGQALQTRTDYTPYYNRFNFPISPRDLLAPFAAEAPLYAERGSASACLTALRAGFLERQCRDIQREGYRYDENTVGAEQAALHHVLSDVLGEPAEAAQVVRSLTPIARQRAVMAAVRWGDNEGLECLLSAGARFTTTAELARLLVAVPDTEKRMQWLREDSRLTENDRRLFVYGQNINCLLALLHYGLDVEPVACAMLEQPSLDPKILELLLNRGLDVNYVHPVTRQSLAQRALYTRNFAAVAVLKRHGTSAEALAAAVLNDFHSIN